MYMGIRISLPQLKAAAKDFVFGRKVFPGHFRFSRAATMTFASFYLDRRDISAHYAMAYSALATIGPEAQTQFIQVCLQEKLFMLRFRKKPGLIPTLPTHYCFRKTLEAEHINKLVTALNESFGKELFKSDGRGKFWLELAPVSPEEPLPVSLKNSVRAALEKKDRPLTLADLKIALLNEQRAFSDSELTSAISELLEAGIVKTAADFENTSFYISAKEQALISARLLFKVIGFSELVDKGGLLGYRRTGRIVKLIGHKSEEYADVLFLKQSHSIPHLFYYTEKGPAAIRTKDLELVQAKERLLFGLTPTGGRVAIQNSPACREQHKKALTAYELSRLKKLLHLHNLPEDFADKLLTAASKLKQPVYLLLYRARKILAMNGSMSLAMLSLHLETNNISDPAQAELIKQCQELSAWPFSLGEASQSEDYIDNLIRMQRQVAANLDVLRLILAAGISRVVYETETLDLHNKAEWNKMCFLYAPVAEQNGFEALASQLRDLYLMNIQPEKYIEAAIFFRRQTGMSRTEAVAFLEKTALELKQKTCNEWLGLNESEVDIYFRPKSYYSIAIKTRDVRDLLGLRICFNCRGVTPEEQAAQSLTALQAMKPKLINYLLSAHGIQEDKGNIKDNITDARASGWRGLKIYGYKDQEMPGKSFACLQEIEVIAQTEQMYRFEKQSQISQAHWAREVNKVLNQEFDDHPEKVMSLLSLNAESNFAVLKQNDQDNVFVFAASQDDNLLFGDQPPNPASLTFAPEKLPIVYKQGEAVRPIPEDVFCSMHIGSRLDLAQLSRVDIYRFGKNKNGQPVLVKKKTPDIYHLESGDVLVFRGLKVSPNTVMARLKHLKNHAVYHLTRFNAWFRQNTYALIFVKKEKERQEKQAEFRAELERLKQAGKKLFDKQYDMILKRRQIKIRKSSEIIRENILATVSQAFEYDSEEKFLAALGLDFIEQQQLIESISHAIENTGYWYDFESQPNSTHKITIGLADKKGILHQLRSFGILTKDNLLSLTTSPYTSFGQKRVTVEFTTNSPVSENQLQACIESLFSRKQDPTTTTTDIIYPRLTTFVLQLPPAPGKTWESFIELVDNIQEQPGMNILEVNLPPAKQQAPGRIRIEIPDNESSLGIFRLIAETLEATIEEI